MTKYRLTTLVDKILKYFILLWICVLSIGALSVATSTIYKRCSNAQPIDSGQLVTAQQNEPIKGSACIPRINLSLITLESVQFVIPPTSNLASKNRNPFNLRYRGQYNAVPGVGGFAQFETIKDGVIAGYNQIELDAQRGHTIGSFIHKYAPPCENDTGGYIKFITEGLGCEDITLLTDVDLFNIGILMMKMESGTEMIIK